MQNQKKGSMSEKSVLKIVNYLCFMSVRIMRSQKASMEESFGKVTKII